MITAVQSTHTFFALTFCLKTYTHRQKWSHTEFWQGTLYFFFSEKKIRLDIPHESSARQSRQHSKIHRQDSHELSSLIFSLNKKKQNKKKKKKKKTIRMLFTAIVISTL